MIQRPLSENPLCRKFLSDDGKAVGERLFWSDLSRASFVQIICTFPKEQKKMQICVLSPQSRGVNPKSWRMNKYISQYRELSSAEFYFCIAVKLNYR